MPYLYNSTEESKMLMRLYREALKHIETDRRGFIDHATTYDVKANMMRVVSAKAIEAVNEACESVGIGYSLRICFDIGTNDSRQYYFLESILISSDGTVVGLSRYPLNNYGGVDSRLEDIAAGKRALLAIDWNISIDEVFSGECPAYFIAVESGDDDVE